MNLQENFNNAFTAWLHEEELTSNENAKRFFEELAKLPDNWVYAEAFSQYVVSEGFSQRVERLAKRKERRNT